MKKNLLLLLFSICFTALAAQDLKPVNEFMINVDYAKFRYDDQSTYLEIYYACFPNQLTYHLVDGKYQAGVKLHTQLLNSETKAVLIDNRVILPVSINDTTDVAYRYPFTSQSGHVLPFGNYSLMVVAADSLNPTRKDSVILPLTLKAYADELVSSDLELCCNIKSSSNTSDPFYKNRLEVMPNATLIFGITFFTCCTLILYSGAIPLIGIKFTLKTSAYTLNIAHVGTNTPTHSPLKFNDSKIVLIEPSTPRVNNN